MRGHHALTETKSSFNPVTVVSRNSQCHLHFTNSRLTVVSISEIRLLSSQTQKCSEGGITSLSVELIRVGIISCFYLFIFEGEGGAGTEDLLLRIGRWKYSQSEFFSVLGIQPQRRTKNNFGCCCFYDFTLAFA